MGKVCFIVLPQSQALAAAEHLLPHLIDLAGGATTCAGKGAWKNPQGSTDFEDVVRIEFLLERTDPYNETREAISRFLARSGSQEEAVYFGVGINAYVQPTTKIKAQTAFNHYIREYEAEQAANRPLQPGDVVRSAFTGRTYFVLSNEERRAHAVMIHTPLRDNNQPGSTMWLYFTDVRPDGLNIIAQVPELLNGRTS